VATSLVLVPLTIIGVFALPTGYFALVLGLALLVAAAEWTRLAGIAAPGGRAGYIALIAGCLFLLWPLIPVRWTVYLLAAVALCWAVVAGALMTVRRPIEVVQGVDPLLLVLGLPVLLGPWAAMVRLHGMSADGPSLVLFLFALIWVVDSVAFFAGRRWGRTKLAPLLSPGKTRTGVYAGLLGAGLCGLVLGWYLDSQPSRIAAAAALGLGTAVFSVVGDLFESLLKRRRGLKDSGHLLPGHGGLLDRIDSLTAAAPVFALGILWMEAHL
jgi:phosphatidate cytidylyltransferase